MRDTPLQQPTDSKASSTPPPVLHGRLCAVFSGHATAVNYAGFSSTGDALLTASATSGCACVWRWEPGFANPSSIVLRSAVGGSDAATAPPATARRGPRAAASAKARRPAEVDMCAWTCDDKHVITAQSLVRGCGPHGKGV